MQRYLDWVREPEGIPQSQDAYGEDEEEESEAEMKEAEEIPHEEL